MKVLITPRSFDKFNSKGQEVLLSNNIDIIKKSDYSKKDFENLIMTVDAIILGDEIIDRELLDKANNLKVISKFGAGLNNIDIEYAHALGIDITNTGDANSEAVADFTIALMLAISRNLINLDENCRNKKWEKSPGIDFHHKKVGIIGYGNIGKRVAHRALSFSNTILVYNRSKIKEADCIKQVSLETLLKESDFVSVHLPLTKETNCLIGIEQLNLMKNTSFLINTSRGGLVSEEALFRILKNKRIKGAALDVFEEEPFSNEKLLELDNLILTPHAAASSENAITSMSYRSALNVIKCLAKKCK